MPEHLNGAGQGGPPRSLWLSLRLTPSLLLPSPCLGLQPPLRQEERAELAPDTAGPPPPGLCPRSDIDRVERTGQAVAGSAWGNDRGGPEAPEPEAA